MICPTCDRETAAVLELGDMGAKGRKRCAHPDCKAALPDEKPASFISKVIEPVSPAEAVIRKHSLPANGAPPSFAQIVAQSEARLLQVRERIAELRSLETEEKQLVLILTAAGRKVPETKPS